MCISSTTLTKSPRWKKPCAPWTTWCTRARCCTLGASNFAAWQVMKALGISAKEGLAPFAVLQPMYNLVKRQAEVEILPMAEAEELGVITYSPLGGGLLTGKYAGEQQTRRWAVCWSIRPTRPAMVTTGCTKQPRALAHSPASAAMTRPAWPLPGSAATRRSPRRSSARAA